MLDGAHYVSRIAEQEGKDAFFTDIKTQQKAIPRPTHRARAPRSPLFLVRELGLDDESYNMHRF